jgi:hypothetical protein
MFFSPGTLSAHIRKLMYLPNCLIGLINVYWPLAMHERALLSAAPMTCMDNFPRQVVTNSTFIFFTTSYELVAYM